MNDISVDTRAILYHPKAYIDKIASIFKKYDIKHFSGMKI